MHSEKIKNFLHKKRQAEQSGGEERIQGQHDKGKLTARERIDLLLDEGSFTEIDAMTTHHYHEFDIRNLCASGRPMPLADRRTEENMKAFELGKNNGIDALTMVDRPMPNPGHGQVVVKMHAMSLNYRDLIIAKSAMGKRETPVLPVSDGAGEVAEIGPGVTRVRVV